MMTSMQYCLADILQAVQPLQRDSAKTSADNVTTRH